MIKNIIIINDFDYIQGGASKVAIQTANLLCENYNIIFFSGDSKGTKVLDSRVKNICTHQVEALKDKNKLRGIINGLYNFRAKKELEKILKTLNKEETIIHIHGWTKCLSSSIFDIIFKMRFKVILTMHDYFTACPNGGYFNYKENKICNKNAMSFKCIKCNCDSRNYIFKIYRILRQLIQNKKVKINEKITDVISISDKSEEILRKTLNKNIEIHRVYNPIDFKFSVENIEPSNNKYYLYLGRISKEKGADIFCKAIEQLDLKGIVVGDGKEKNELEKEYKKINFVGWKSSEEVQEYIKNAKALIFPSRLYETAGLTVLEAQALGIPTIVSDISVAKEFIKNPEVFTFKCNDIEDLKEKILLYEKSDINNISKEIKKVFNQEYLKFNYKESIIRVYEEI